MKNPGIFMVMTFFILLVVNALVVFLANNFFPTQVVLGTATTSLAWAGIVSSGVIALVATFAMPFVNALEANMGREWKPAEMMVIYLVINFVAVWLITRVSQVFGLGVSSWMVVLALSVVLDVIQGGVMMAVGKMRTKK